MSTKKNASPHGRATPLSHAGLTESAAELLLKEQNELIRHIATSTSLDDSLEVLTQSIGRLSPEAKGAVIVADPDVSRFERVYSAVLPETLISSVEGMPINEEVTGSCGEAVKKAEGVTCADIAREPGWDPGWSELLLNHGLQACHSEPVMGSKGTPLGTLMLGFEEPREPSQWEVTIARTLAHVASVMIERDRSERDLRTVKERLERELEDARLLQSISTQLIHEDDTERLYEDIVQAACSLMRSEFASLQMLAPDGSSLRLLSNVGLDDESAEYWNVVSCETNSSCAVAFREAKRSWLSLTSDDKDEPGVRHFHYYRQLGIKLLQSTPLVSRSGQLVGMISTHWREETEPSEDRLRALDVLARQAADLIERAHNEDIARKAQERFALAQKAGNVGIWDWDAATDKTYWSQAMWDFYSGSPETDDPTHKFWISHVVKEDRKRVEENLARVLDSQAAHYRDEFGVTRKNGSVRWIESVADIVRDDDGKVLRMYGVNIDITQQRQAAEQTRRNEEQLRLVTDALPALISYVDDKGRYQFVNKAYERWFGGGHGDLIGKSVKQVIGKKAYSAIRPRLDEVFAGEQVNYDAVLNYESIGERFIHGSYIPDIGTDGKVRGFYAMITDLTELRRSELALRESEHRLSLLAENVRDYAIFTTDEEGIIDTWNIGAENIFGFREEEAIGQNAEVLFTAEDRARGIPLREMRLAKRNLRAADERWHVRKDGSRFYASGVMVPIKIEGRSAGFAKIAQDLTERKRQAEDLQRAHDELEFRVLERTRELGELNTALQQEVVERKAAEGDRVRLLKRIVATQEDERKRIARDIHDQLGQGLTALRLKLASLSDGAGTGAAMHEGIKRVQEIAAQIDAEASFLAWELRPVVLDELGLSEALDTFRREWSRHYSIPAAFHSINLKKQRLNKEVETHLYRIAQEALNNIIKHAKATNVSIILERSPKHLVLIIEDDGIGVALEDHTHITASGKGLGIAGMKERAALIGGELEIESELGSGTTVYARVPAEAALAAEGGENEHRDA